MKIINDKKEINWGLIVLLILNGFYWVNVYYFGFIMPTLLTIILSAIVGLWYRLTGRI